MRLMPRSFIMGVVYKAFCQVLRLAGSSSMDSAGTSNEVAKALHVPANRITSILKGQRGITADTALRLGRYFGTTPKFWTNLQASYDLKIALKESGEKISSEIIPLAS